MQIELKHFNWKLKGYWPYVPLLGKSVELGNELLGVTEWMDATVPGGVHYDLLKAGYIEDPYFELNSLKCEWVENRWWMYKTVFPMGRGSEDKMLTLVFKGIDYKAYFYLNGEKLGEHEGMYEAVTFDITGRVRFDSDNELVVLLEHAPKEMAQIGCTSLTKTQKSRFNYKWDFSTRLVNIGIWDDVLIKATGKLTLHDTFVSTGLENETGFINISSKIIGNIKEYCSVKVFIDFKGENIENSEETVILDKEEYIFDKRFIIGNPKLWHPNGMGDQALYRVKIQVFQGDILSDEEEYHTGIRKVEYRRNIGSSEDTLPYTFIINGKPIYIKGVNVVPFDMLYGNISRETYERYIYRLKAANINMVRVWGGGIIEKECFYQLCDLNGIMVWQEFIQSSSGIENIPSTDPHFLKLLKATAIQAVKTKRNHACHIVWSGGNELTDDIGKPVTYENPNIKMLKTIVDEYDPEKLFLPTSASGPNEFLNINQPGKNHDVHGSWKYEGIERHYKIFNTSDSLFHSEFGVDGCSNIESLMKFLGEKNLKVEDMHRNLVWRHHGEWWDTLPRDREIFGNFNSLEQFVKASQFIQAEGLRYALEANRRRKFENSGSIVWQFNEPWPNISCTSLVDYYGSPKMAYYWLKVAYEPIHVSLCYDKLSYKPMEEFTAEVHVNNSFGEQELTVCWEVIEPDGNLIYKEETRIITEADRTSRVKKFELVIPELKSGIFFVRVKAFDLSEKLCSQNLYIFSQLEKEIFSTLLAMESEIEIEKSGSTYRIRNKGKEVCLFIHGKDAAGRNDIIIDNNYACIFPREEQVFEVHRIRFDDMNDNHGDDVIRWDCLNRQVCSNQDGLKAIS